MIRPATSYVATTFHPTIGHRAHQSLSNTATPELGTLVENEKLVTKKMTKIRISMTTFGLAIAGG